MGVKAVVQKFETVNKRQIKGRVKHETLTDEYDPESA